MIKKVVLSAFCCAMTCVVCASSNSIDQIGCDNGNVLGTGNNRNLKEQIGTQQTSIQTTNDDTKGQDKEIEMNVVKKDQKARNTYKYCFDNELTQQDKQNLWEYMINIAKYVSENYVLHNKQKRWWCEVDDLRWGKYDDANFQRVFAEFIARLQNEISLVSICEKIQKDITELERNIKEQEVNKRVSSMWCAINNEVLKQCTEYISKAKNKNGLRNICGNIKTVAEIINSVGVVEELYKGLMSNGRGLLCVHSVNENSKMQKTV